MFKEEALWLFKKIDTIGVNSISPICNIGSSNEEFRKKIQPWVNRVLIEPLIKKNFKILHLDKKKGNGIDIIGDIISRKTYLELKKLKIKSILCNSLFEHITDRIKAAQNILDIIPIGGYIIISVPHKYPHHNDPIDTHYRPNIDELHSLFPGSSVCYANIVKVKNNKDYRSFPNIGVLQKELLSSLSQIYKPWILLKTLKRIILYFMAISKYIPWLFIKFSVTCLVLKKDRDI